MVFVAAMNHTGMLPLCLASVHVTAVHDGSTLFCQSARSDFGAQERAHIRLVQPPVAAAVLCVQRQDGMRLHVFQTGRSDNSIRRLDSCGVGSSMVGLQCSAA